MISLFLGITVFNLVALGVTSALGYIVKQDPAFWSAYHQLSGVLATIACVAVHCTVLTYFMATAKWVQHAIAVKRLDPALAGPTRSFKAQAFPAALVAMAIVFVTAITGVATFSGSGPKILHHLLAVVSLAVNAMSAVVEYRAIVRNGGLIDRILGEITPSQTV
jgi:hypothetical protein